MRLVLMIAVALIPASVRAETLDDTKAFDHAFAASFYTYDACGEGKYGVIFRKALDARFAECPFTPQARAAHLRRNRLQSEKSHDMMNALIEQTGGMPTRLPGMEETCRQQQKEPDYVATREKLARFADGALKPEDILPGPCDADVVAP